MLQTSINYKKRLDKISNAMNENGYDFVILTSLPTLAYSSNIYQSLAWYVNTCVVISKNGRSTIIVPYSDFERISNETWIEDIQTWNPPLKNRPERKFEKAISEFIQQENVTNPVIGIESNLTWTQHTNIINELSNAQFKPCGTLLENLMVIKEVEELPYVRKAANLCDIGYQAAIENVTPGMTEIELCGVIELAMRKEGCDGYWVPNQAGTYGPGETVLLDKYPTDKVIKDDHIVKFGIHPSYKNYRGDICVTATFRKPEPAFKTLADVCAEATEACIDIIKPGIRSKDIDLTFRNIMEKNGYGDYVGWYIGHGIGTGHLPPFIASDDESIIQENMVIVINTMAVKGNEPGVVYETMVLVTKDGHERLNTNPIHLVELF